ncbi:putative N6-adenosine-methyltransferase MT-A70-like protein [Echinococcus granulosus]|nr:putative N6-adenosine-methyltransferase MT-A70-like protein [Echinococcus granulosus]
MECADEVVRLITADKIALDSQSNHAQRWSRSSSCFARQVANGMVYLVSMDWIKCDTRWFDMIILDEFAVIMADPPWDLRMKLPYGTMSDYEMRKTDTPCLQDDEYIFLWVTGRYLMQEVG